MRIKLTIGNFKATVTDSDGTPLLDYDLKGYELEGDVKGLVRAGLKVRDEIVAAVTNEDMQRAFANATSDAQQ